MKCVTIIILLLFLVEKVFHLVPITWKWIIWMRLSIHWQLHFMSNFDKMYIIPTVATEEIIFKIQRIHRINWWQMDKWSRFHILVFAMNSCFRIVCVLDLFYYRWHIHYYTFAVSPVDTYTNSQTTCHARAYALVGFSQ